MDKAFARSVNKEKTAMRKMIITAVGAVALIGSARAEHVNLWPLYYSDGSSASIAWPLISYTDSTDWRVGTIYREHSEWGVFPFYMDFGSSVVLTPFVVAKDWSGGAILPLAYADFKGDDTFWTVFPAVYSHRWEGGENSTFWAAAGLGGRKVRGGETESHWLAPLWWRWPKERRCVFAAGLAGWDHLRDDEKCDWLLPFYWRNQDIFWSIPWACGYDADGKITGWFSLPLLSWCRGDEVHITPIAGKTEHSNWLAPVYYWNDEGTFCTLFGGKTKEASWILPLYYKDKDAFVSLPIYYRNSEDFFTIPYARKNHTEFYLCGLAGRSRRPEATNDWVMPFWYRDDSSFCSIPYGCICEGETTLNWWGLPLFQTRSGACHGFGIQPVVEYKRDRKLDVLEKAMDANRLTEELISELPWNSIRGEQAEESLEWLLGLAGSEHSIRVGKSSGAKGRQMTGGDKESELVVFNERHGFGNILLLKSRCWKSVKFDSETGTREGVSESGSSHFLGFVWNSNWRKENGAVVSSESSILWRVWRSKLEDGHSTLDIFPWFSRERDQNGKTTTSFLWGFFRYENDPAKGSSLDLLFIPVWR